MSQLFQIRRLFSFFPFIFQSSTPHRHNARPKVHPVIHRSKTASIPSTYKDMNFETEPTVISRNKSNATISRHFSSNSWEVIQEMVEINSPSPIKRENNVVAETLPKVQEDQGKENENDPIQQDTNPKDNFKYHNLVVEEHSSIRC